MARQAPINNPTTPNQKWRPMPAGTPYPTDPLIEAARPKTTQYDEIMHSPAKLVLSNKMNKYKKFEYLELSENNQPNFENAKEKKAQANNDVTKNSKIYRDAGYDSDDECDQSPVRRPTIEEQLNIIKITPELVGLCVCIIGFLGYLTCIVKRPTRNLY